MNNPPPTVILLLTMGLCLICIFAVGHYFLSTTSRTRHKRRSRKAWKHTTLPVLLLLAGAANAQPVPEGRYTVEYRVWIGGQFITAQEETCIVRPWRDHVTVMECREGYIRRDMREIPNALMILDTPFIEVGPGQFRFTNKDGGVEYRFKLPGVNL